MKHFHIKLLLLVVALGLLTGCYFFAPGNDVADLEILVNGQATDELKVNFGESVQLSVIAWDAFGQKLTDFAQPSWNITHNYTDKDVGELKVKDPFNLVDFTAVSKEKVGAAEYVEGIIEVEVKTVYGYAKETLKVIVGTKPEETPQE